MAVLIGSTLFSFLMIMTRVLSYEKSIKKYKKNKLVLDTILLNKTEAYNNLISSLIYLLCPALVCLRSQYAFFIIISILLIAKIWVFLFQKRLFPRWKKILRGLMIAIYLIYHLAYMTLFVFQEMEVGTYPNILNGIKYLGFLIIFLILLGGVIEIFDFLVPLLIFLFSESVGLYVRAREKIRNYGKAQDE